VITTIAAQQVVALRRQRIFLAALVTLLAMTSLAGLIGWLSHHTVVRAYDEAVRLLQADGRRVPPDPLALRPPLALLSNLSIYIPLIGALLAVVLGHLSLVDDQADGIGRLIFSRPVSRTDFILGKLLAVAVVAAAILAASLVASVVSLLVVNGAVPSAAEFGRLSLFYGISWLYLLLFALIGMVGVLTLRHRSLALLAAVGVWMVLTFAVPQFTSGLRPTASLNPVTDPVSTSQPFFAATAHARPISVSEQYKTASAQILQTADPEPWTDTARRVLPLAGSVALLGGLTVRLVRRHDYSKGAADD
jgi:ABC-type transport system involved in multi-copper enzyme maturation permease subunit